MDTNKHEKREKREKKYRIFERNGVFLSNDYIIFTFILSPIRAIRVIRG
jgi:hypothetical protein